MGRSKNRKKRHLGRIRKFVENIYPVTKKDYSLRREHSFEIWCGGWAWLSAVFNGFLDVCISEAHRKAEMVVAEDGFKYPKHEREANDKRFRRFLQFMKEFDESKIPGKRFHNKKIARLRQRYKEEQIKIRESCLENKED